MRILLAPLLMLLLSACSPSHHGEEQSDSLRANGVISEASLNGFRTTVYALGNQIGCVACHGKLVNPQWMNSDVTIAYNLSRPMLDVNNPSASPWATYVSNNHCNNPICANPANNSAMLDALTQWATAEFAQGGVIESNGTTLPNPPYVTATIPIPANLPQITSTRVAVVRFDLTMMTPQIPALAGATLEVSIQSYNSLNTTYKIFNPRLVGNSAPVRLQGIHVYVRPTSGSGLGVEDSNLGDLWSALNVPIPVTAAPATIPATTPMTSIAPFTSITLGVDSQSTADSLTIGFAAIQ